ncbi:TA system VapC family ribonuclease toxin [Gordonia sp. NPDC003504]
MSDLDLPDVNVLVALVHPGHIHHDAAQDWLRSVARFATTPITEAGLLRMALNKVVMGRAVEAEAAIETLRSIREHERAVFLPDDSSLAQAAVDLSGLAGFRQVTDLHLVNLAARHSGRLITFDAKIARVLTPSDQQSVLTLA